MSEMSEKILIVDDEGFNRRLLLRLLRAEGYDDVDEAENGRVALEMLQRAEYDTVLLDVMMPEMSGFELLTELKRDMRLREIPVIMISGNSDAESAIRCIKLGASDYLLKPVDKVLLQARLGSCLERKHHHNQQIEYITKMRQEKERADQLLNVILPTAAANELKILGKVPPRSYQNVAILFCDIVGFTAYCNEHNAEEVVNGLQNLFESLEKVTRELGLEKIKTIGDAFMVSAGLLIPCSDPIDVAVTCGLKMIELAENNDPPWQLRCGVSSGAVIAGIVGHDRYQFDVWGDTVNTASRFTGIARPGSVAISVDSWMTIQDGYEARSRGKTDIKGKGAIEIIEVYAKR